MRLRLPLHGRHQGLVIRSLVRAMTAYVPCPRDCHKDCLYNTAASGCPRILYEDRIVVLENALAEADAKLAELEVTT